MSWILERWRRLIEPRAVRLARKKRELQELCRECGVSRAKSIEIASRYFNEVAK